MVAEFSPNEKQRHPLRWGCGVEDLGTGNDVGE